MHHIDRGLLASFPPAVSVNVGRLSQTISRRNPNILQIGAGIEGTLGILESLATEKQLLMRSLLSFQTSNPPTVEGDQDLNGDRAELRFSKQVQGLRTQDPEMVQSRAALETEGVSRTAPISVGVNIGQDQSPWARAEIREEKLLKLDSQASLADIAKKMAELEPSWSRQQARGKARELQAIIARKKDGLSLKDLKAIRGLTRRRSALKEHFQAPADSDRAPPSGKSFILSRRNLMVGAGVISLAAVASWFFTQSPNRPSVGQEAGRFPIYEGIIPTDVRELIPRYTKVIVPPSAVQTKPLHEIRLSNDLGSIQETVSIVIRWFKEWHYPYPEVLDRYETLLKRAKPADSAWLTSASFFAKERDYAKGEETQVYVNVPKVYGHLQTILEAKSQDFFVENFALWIGREAWGAEAMEWIGPEMKLRSQVATELVPKLDQMYDLRYGLEHPETGRIFFWENRDELTYLAATDIVLEFYEAIRQLEMFLWANKYFYSAHRALADVQKMKDSRKQRIARAEAHTLDLVKAGPNPEAILTYQLSRMMNVALQTYAQTGRVAGSLNNYLFFGSLSLNLCPQSLPRSLNLMPAHNPDSIQKELFPNGPDAGFDL